MYGMLILWFFCGKNEKDILFLMILEIKPELELELEGVSKRIIMVGLHGLFYQANLRMCTCGVSYPPPPTITTFYRYVWLKQNYWGNFRITFGSTAVNGNNTALSCTPGLQISKLMREGSSGTILRFVLSLVPREGELEGMKFCEYVYIMVIIRLLCS